MIAKWPLPLALVLAAGLAGDAHAADPLVDIGRVGGYGGPYLRVTRLHGGTGVTGGGPIAMALVGRWGLGLVWQSTEGDLDGRWFTYVGARGEFYFAHAGPLHASLGHVFGCGGLLKAESTAPPGATFVVSEPDATLAWQFARSTRLAVTAGYRFVPWTSNDRAWSGRDLSGPFAGVALQYGVFPEAQDGTPPSTQLSGFFSEKLTVVGGEAAWLDGGGTRLLLGRYLSVGVTGYSSRNNVTIGGRSTGVGYGALEGAITLNPVGPVKVLTGLLAGMGGAGWKETDRAGIVTEKASVVAIVEPELLGEIDLVRFVRVAAGATYRFAICAACEGPVRAGSLGGPSAVAQIRFGWF